MRIKELNKRRISLLEVPEIISGNPEFTVEYGEFSYQIEATNNPISYSTSDLPEGLTLDTTTGIISGIAPSWGEYQVTVSATNEEGTTSKNLVFSFVVELNQGALLYTEDETAFCTNSSRIQTYTNNRTLGESTIIYEMDKKTKVSAGYYAVQSTNYYYYDGNETITQVGGCSE